MAEVSIYGIEGSPYVRTARMACEEKGVSYTMEGIGEIRGPEHLKLHPFGKIPILRHADFMLYETSAIVHYINDAFEGPALVPTTPRARAAMEQWISVYNSYVYGPLSRYALSYIFPKGPGGTPDRAVIEAALSDMTRPLELVNAGLVGKEWFAGQTFSLADLFYAPPIAILGMFPEGAALLEKLPEVKRHAQAVQKRPCFIKSNPAPNR